MSGSTGVLAGSTGVLAGSTGPSTGDTPAYEKSVLDSRYFQPEVRPEVGPVVPALQAFAASRW